MLIATSSARLVSQTTGFFPMRLTLACKLGLIQQQRTCLEILLACLCFCPRDHHWWVSESRHLHNLQISLACASFPHLHLIICWCSQSCWPNPENDLRSTFSAMNALNGEELQGARLEISLAKVTSAQYYVWFTDWQWKTCSPHLTRRRRRRCWERGSKGWCRPWLRGLLSSYSYCGVSISVGCYQYTQCAMCI